MLFDYLRREIMKSLDLEYPICPYCASERLEVSGETGYMTCMNCETKFKIKKGEV